MTIMAYKSQRETAGIQAFKSLYYMIKDKSMMIVVSEKIRVVIKRLVILHILH